MFSYRIMHLSARELLTQVSGEMLQKKHSYVKSPARLAK